MFFSKSVKNSAAKFPKRNIFLLMAMASCFSNVALADAPTGNVLTTETELKSKMFVTTDAEDALNELEREAIQISEKYTAKNKETLRPIAGQNGTVRFVYGAHQPSIVCAVLHYSRLEYAH